MAFDFNNISIDQHKDMLDSFNEAVLGSISQAILDGEDIKDIIGDNKVERWVNGDNFVQGICNDSFFQKGLSSHIVSFLQDEVIACSDPYHFLNNSRGTFSTIFNANTPPEFYNPRIILIGATATPEFHKQRGFLDTRLDSRTDLIGLEKLLPGFKMNNYSTLDCGIKIYQTDDSYPVAIVPVEQWNNATISLKGFKDGEDLDVLLFVTDYYSTIGGYQFVSELVVFRGVFIKDSLGIMKLKGPRFEL